MDPHARQQRIEAIRRYVFGVRGGLLSPNELERLLQAARDLGLNIAWQHVDLNNPELTQTLEGPR